MDTYKRLEELMNAKNLTAYRVAKETGMSPVVFTDWKNGKSLPKQDKMKRIAEYLNTSEQYLRGYIDDPRPLPGIDILPEDMVVIDLVATVAAGYDHGADTDIIEQVAVPSFMLKGYAPSECKMITVKGDSMWPRFGNGDRAIFHLQTSVDSGSIAVIQVNGDEYTLKRVTYATGEDWFKLEPINPAFPVKKVEGADMQDCRIIGLVLSSLRVE